MSVRRIDAVLECEAPQRLDRALLPLIKAAHPLMTRSQLERWIEDGLVTVGGTVVLKGSMMVKSGLQVGIVIPESYGAPMTAESGDLEILHEDESLIVLNKPAGIAMHPGAGNRSRSIANILLPKLEASGWKDPQRPGIVHRLDKDTTGVVVVAKNVGVHAALAAQFSERSVDRQYVALALSKPRKPSFDGIDEGSIDAPIGRDQRDRRKMAVVTTESGKRAITNWRVIERMEYAVLLSLKLGTGRTHQIRVHLAAKGSPVLGDRTYGDHRILPRELARAAVEFGRQALHAATLGFTHPVTSKRLHFEAAAPADFEQLVERFRSVGSEHGA